MSPKREWVTRMFFDPSSASTPVRPMCMKVQLVTLMSFAPCMARTPGTPCRVVPLPVAGAEKKYPLCKSTKPLPEDGSSHVLYLNSRLVNRTRSVPSRRRDCHYTDTPVLSILIHLLKVEGVQQNDSLANGYPCPAAP